MNSLLNGWQLAGWTMILFLATGTVLLVAAGGLRLLLRHVSANVRYAASLASFVLLAMLPLIIAGSLVLSLPPLTREAHQTIEIENAMASRQRQRPEDLATEVTESTEIIADIPAISSSSSSRFDLESILNQSVTFLPWLWITGTPLTFLLLASGLLGAERLRRSCRLLADGPIHAACEELRTTLKLSRKVGVAICESIASPLVVGVVKPLILLPPAALTGWSPEHLEMVLVHELAHVRRWDNGVNLMQRVVESLLFFHPAVWIVSGWVRRDREDCCDAIVVRHTAKPQAYAELLLALASRQPLVGLATTAAMAKHPVASRIRRILKLQDEPMLVSRQALGFLASAVLACALAVGLFTTSEAEESVSLEAERVADERSDGTTKTTNGTNQDLATENTENTEEKNAEDVEIRRAYVLDEQGDEIKELLKTIGGLSIVHVTSLEGKETALVQATQKGHEKLVELLESKRQSTTNPLFPTLEDQRAADLAYKLLGVELEKLMPEELERVKAKGYQGGLRVGANGMLAEHDILVGLHVWPTESLEQVTDILSRNDLDQLSPLKFYVIRDNLTRPAGSPNQDRIVSGRIEVRLDAWRENRRNQERSSYILSPHDVVLIHAKQRQGELSEKLIDDAYSVDEDGTINLGPTYGKVPANVAIADLSKIIQNSLPNPKDCIVEVKLLNQSTQKTRLGVDQPATASLLYDGKTFDEWRGQLQSELKPEKRIECLEALVAFSRSGRGDDAADAILAVAGEFDWKNRGDPLQEKCLLAFYALNSRVALKAVLEAADSDDTQVVRFAELVALGLGKSDSEIRAQIKEKFPELEFPETRFENHK